MIINDLDGYYIVFDTKNWNTELDTLLKCSTISYSFLVRYFTNKPFVATKISNIFHSIHIFSHFFIA